MSTATTAAHSATRRWTSARPMPEAAPVTRATCCSKRIPFAPYLDVASGEKTAEAHSSKIVISRNRQNMYTVSSCHVYLFEL
jgi:hypothetical protein